MLHAQEPRPAALVGKHQAIDDWLSARQKVLIDYMQLVGTPNQRHKSRPLPSLLDLQSFCDQLMDYVSAGHFEIYQHIAAAFEQASGDQQMLAKQIYPHIERSTAFVLEFNDKYSAPDEAQLLELDADLSQLGSLLEERFALEDKLVVALRVTEWLLSPS
ncbi:MAG: sigma D regulator [Aeromonas sp.]